MVFEQALQALKQGKKVARRPNAYIDLQMGIFFLCLRGMNCHGQSYISNKVTWTPSHEDLLATDWSIL